MKTVFAVAAGIILAFVLLAGWSDFMRGLRPSLRQIENATTATASTTPAAVGAQWKYYSSQDEMGRGVARQASVNSTNMLEFRFPYANPQHATLLLRTHPRYGKNVILQIEHGQFLCTSYMGCTVLVRFDEGAATKYSAVGPSDNSTDAIFIQNYQSFVSRMLKAQRVRIQAEFYQEGAPTLDFDVSGFDATKVQP